MLGTVCSGDEAGGEFVGWDDGDDGAHFGVGGAPGLRGPPDLVPNVEPPATAIVAIAGTDCHDVCPFPRTRNKVLPSVTVSHPP
jgi:hypothetical protein